MLKHTLILTALGACAAGPAPVDAPPAESCAVDAPIPTTFEAYRATWREQWGAPSAAAPAYGRACVATNANGTGVDLYDDPSSGVRHVGRYAIGHAHVGPDGSLEFDATDRWRAFALAPADGGYVGLVTWLSGTDEVGAAILELDAL